MKNLVLVSTFILSCGLLFGQAQQSSTSGYDKYSVSYAFGSHLWGKPQSSRNADLRNFHISHHDLNFRHMLNNRLGYMFDVGFDRFEYAGIADQKTNFVRVSFQGVINFGDMLKLNTINPRLNILLHGGGGYGGMWQNNDVKKTKTDNMISFIAGVTPQIRIAPRWSIKGDVSAIVNYAQNNTFDFVKEIKGKKMGGFVDLSVGLTYHIGKNKNHLDWVPTFNSIGGAEFGGATQKPRY